MKPRLHPFLLIALLSSAATAADGDSRALARDIFEELVEIESVSGTPETVVAAEAMATRLRAAGFSSDEVRVMRLDANHGNLVARYPSPTPRRAPVLMMAHLDVVPALREDWSIDPFEFIERDGYYYGRGTSDNKAGAAMLVANFIRLKREGFVPERDLIIVLTADEESTGASIRWLLAEHRELVDAAFALNTDGGDGMILEGRKAVFNVQAAEKVFQSYYLTARNRGGHSSLPTPDNAIYQLAAGLVRLSKHEFPVALNDISRGYFRGTAKMSSGRLARDMLALVERDDPQAAGRLAAGSPFFNSVMRTTCVATMLEGGHAENALPQLARATVNCRILPGVPPAEVQATLARVVADPGINIEPVEPATPSPPSPLTTDVLGPLERLVAEFFPEAVIVPQMSTGATDGLYVRNAGIPVYGVSALFDLPDDVRAHGADERVPVTSFEEATEFWYRMAKAYASE